MATFEYLMVTFERTARTMFTCAGFTFEAASEDPAREHFRAKLKTGSLADAQLLDHLLGSITRAAPRETVGVASPFAAEVLTPSAAARRAFG